LDKLLADIITDDVYKKKKKELDARLAKLKTELDSFQGMEEMKVVFEKRIQSIREKLENETVEKAAISEMLDNIQFITVFPQYLEVSFFADRLLGINSDSYKKMYQPVEEMEDAFLIKFPLPEDFIYKDRKILERERIVQYMKENPSITAKEIAAKEDVGLSGINYRIKKLRREGRVYFDGTGGKGKWVVVDKEE